MDLTNKQDNHIISTLQQGDEDLVVHDHSCLISFQQQYQHTPDLYQHVSMVGAMDNTTHPSGGSNKKKRGGNRASNNLSLAAAAGGSGGDDHRTEKKMVHREIERHRRQEMSKLYASLRDLLPLEFVKGNRSISDHMHRAVHYIKKKEENIKQLSMKRDQLKKFADINSSNESSKNEVPNTVSVSLCDGGVDILINSCPIWDNFFLSRLLNALIEEGLNIISCNLTKVNDRLLHSIRSEASDLATIDQTTLQQRLVDIVNARPDFN